MKTVPPRVERIYLAILTLCVVRLWASPISSSFWLDECGMVWLTQGDLRDTLARAIGWPGHSVLYALFFSVAKSLVGHSEVLLRLPSLAVMIGALVVLHKLAARLMDRESAWIAVIVFATNQNVIFAAPDARPYSFATFALLAAMWFLVQWLDTGLIRFGVLYAFFAA
ncbi:MAG: glycosyltransferase family 39 protein [Bryobacteraceae bacterium]